MKKLTLAALAAAFALTVACQSYEEEYKQAQQEIETLRAKNADQSSQLDSVNSDMAEIESVLDQIDAAEEALFAGLEEGTSYQSHAERLQTVQGYIEQANQKIAALEQQLSESEGNLEGFLATIRRLREDVETKDLKIQELSEQVDRYKSQNRILIDRVELQKQLIVQHEAEIRQQNQEISTLNNELNQQTYETQEAKGQAHFLLGEKHEEQAKRYVLQRKKRKESFVEAYKQYELAYELGHQEAKARMDDLLARNIIDKEDVQ